MSAPLVTCTPNHRPELVGFDAVAAALLEHEAARLPDLSACTVLLPHLHAASPLFAALRRRITMPVFLPPRVATFATLAAAQPVATPCEAQGQRLAQVHDFLSRTGVVRTQALWPVAAELLDLLDELSAEQAGPADAPEAWLAQVRAAYGARRSRLLEAEAALVLELWQAMQQGEAADTVRDYAHRLALAADAATGPLYVLGLMRPSRLETGLLARWSQRHPVRELPWRAVHPERQALLDAAWGKSASPLNERARRLAETLPASPLLPEVRLTAAGDLESEARAAAEQVRAWAAEGITRIALIALDRLTARRLRALLERDGILIEDETGWTLSTAAVSHVIDRLLALRLDDCYHRDLLDLLKSPFVFADLDPDTRQRAVGEFETALRRAGVVAGLERMHTLARSEVPAALPLLDRLACALARLAGRRRPLGDWQQRLLDALTDLGALPAFASDVAGRQLLLWLQRLTEAVAGHETAYGLAGWREWLALQLDQATFRDDRIDSPVRLVSLTGARLRDFDAAIVLSADAAHLPGSGANGVFGDRVRAQLGLPTSAVRAEDLRAALSDVLCHIPRVLITWQARQEGEPNALSPWLELLDGVHRLAWGVTLKAEAPLYLDLATAPALPATPAARPSTGRVPNRLSASAWQSLVDCPYRFYARHILRLAEVEAVPEEMEKRDYGLLVHAVLQRFHTLYPRLADTPRERLLEELQQITEAVFAPQRQLTYLALAWQLRWQRRMNDYLDWALAREAQGYRWQAGEVERERALPLGGDGVVTLQGRLDRIDQGPQGLAVLDYKVKRRDSLRRRLKQPGEDVQLGFYGLLTDAAEAAYLILDDERVESLGPDVDLPTAAAAERERLRATLAAMAAGAPLPAQGAPHTCAYCEMRGLCRRDYQPG